MEEIKSQAKALTANISFSVPSLNITRFEDWLKDQFDLQNLWVLSHTLTILGTSLYIYSLISENPSLEQNSYKVSTLGSVLTYFIVLYRCNFEEQVEFNENKTKVIVKQRLMSVSELLKNENAQLLGYVLLWNFTARSIVKLIPFFIYSFLNLSSFFVLEIFPGNSLCVAIAPLLNYLEIPLLILASHLDLIVFGILMEESITFYKNAYPFIVYTFLWCLRFENSEASRSSISSILRFVDDQVFQEALPINLRIRWAKFRRHLEFIAPYEFTQLAKEAEEILDPDSAATVT